MSMIKQVFTALDFESGGFGACVNLEELVREIESLAKSDGRVVCSVGINGQRLHESDEVHWGKFLKEDIDFLEVELEKPAELVRSTIQSQIELVGEIDRVAQLTAESLRGIETAQAQELLISVLDGCRWFTDALIALKVPLTALRPDLLGESAWPTAERELKDVLASIMSAVKVQDNVLLADLLEYELANGLGTWRTLLNQFIK